MKRRAKQGCCRASRALVHLSVLIPVAALTIVGTPTSASAASASFASQSARSIISEARHAMTMEGSVSATGEGPVSIPGLDNAVVSETNYTGSKSGRQLLNTTSGSGGQASATTLDVAGNLYVNASVSFWSKSVGLTDPQASIVAGKWVQIPSSSPIYMPAIADLTMSSLTRDMFAAKKYHKGKIQKVDGVRVIKITYTNGGVDSGPATCYVAVGGRHLPVSITIGGLALSLRSWGKKVTIDAPQGAVPLSSLLLPSTPPGTGVVA